jgi:hypothetical protein
MSFLFFFSLFPFGAGGFCQTDTVQALRGDPDSSEAEHMRIMLVQTEVERVKFAVRSYIRTRLYKASTCTHLNIPSG